MSSGVSGAANGRRTRYSCRPASTSRKATVAPLARARRLSSVPSANRAPPAPPAVTVKACVTPSLLLMVTNAKGTAASVSFAQTSSAASA